MGELRPVLSRTAAALDAANAEYAIVGSVAAMAWGVVRSTQDLDVVVLVDSVQGAQLLAAMAGDGELYVPSALAKAAISEAGSFKRAPSEFGRQG